ncbi:MAG: hypothetical protein ACRDH6_04270 [Actinomycetota bacterium]
MRRLRVLFRPGLFLLGAGTLLLGPLAGFSAAHEERRLGNLEAVVGWGTEPAFAGTINSAQLILSRGGQPVVKGVDLEVEVIFGEESTTLTMGPDFVVGVFGEPGDYRASFLPTRAGDYTFRFTGTVQGEEFDEEFSSGPDTFDPIEDPAEISFPAQDPSNAQLAEALERRTDRLSERIEALSGDGSGGTDLWTWVALGLGALALITATGSRRRSPAGGSAGAAHGQHSPGGLPPSGD